MIRRCDASYLLLVVVDGGDNDVGVTAVVVVDVAEMKHRYNSPKRTRIHVQARSRQQQMPQKSKGVREAGGGGDGREEGAAVTINTTTRQNHNKTIYSDNDQANSTLIHATRLTNNLNFATSVSSSSRCAYECHLPFATCPMEYSVAI